MKSYIVYDGTWLPLSPSRIRDMVEIEMREEFEADRKARLAEIGEKGLGLSRAELLEAVDGVEA